METAFDLLAVQPFLAGIDGTQHALQLIQQGTFYRASAALNRTSAVSASSHPPPRAYPATAA